MKIAYLILTHDTPLHTHRLVDTLATPAAHFFIHLDRKSDARAFSAIRGPKVGFVTGRLPVYWGDWSITDAILVLLRTALAADPGFDRLILLSGADYPLRSAAYIEAYLHGNRDREFINLVEMPSAAANKPLSRLTEYRLRDHDSRVRNCFRRRLMQLGVMPRQRDFRAVFGDLVPYAGSTWWALTHAAGEYVLEFVRDNPRVVDFYRNTLLADESMFQTILGNSPFGPRIARNLMYTDWRAEGPHPATISARHLAYFRSAPVWAADDAFGPGELLFARKFSDGSGALLDVLDRDIRRLDTPSG